MKFTGKGYRIFMFFNISFMVLIAVISLFPYLHIVAKALNQGIDSSMGGITIYPRVPTLENFKIILKDMEIWNAARITIMAVVVYTSLAIIIQFGAAYALRRKSLPGRNGLLLFFMIPMFINAGLIPAYILYSRIGLLNNFMVYILPGAFSFYNMIIIRTYMNSSIPASLEESARIDGANEITIFSRIILPLSKPILATIMLWLAVAEWNEWTKTLYFITNSKLFTLQYKLVQIIKESERIIRLLQENPDLHGLKIDVTPDSLVAAQIVVTSLPIIMVYPFLQKYFIKGVMLGAVKE